MKRKLGRPKGKPTKTASFRVLKKNHKRFVKEVKPIAKKYSHESK